MLQGSMEKGLPPGFRFHPTDEELVLQYLKRKAFSWPLPAAIIPEIDFAKLNPRDLPGGEKSASYFFHLRMAKYQKGSRSNRATASGYWKATGRDKHIIASKSGQVVGMKKVLVFFQGRPPAAFRTYWVMHEYRLAHSSGQHSGDWVLCRVFTKKRAAEMDSEIEEGSAEEQWRDRRSCRLGMDAYPSCSLNLSCVTELSDGSGDGEASGSSSFCSSPP